MLVVTLYVWYTVESRCMYGIESQFLAGFTIMKMPITPYNTLPRASHSAGTSCQWQVVRDKPSPPKAAFASSFVYVSCCAFWGLPTPSCSEVRRDTALSRFSSGAPVLLVKVLPDIVSVIGLLHPPFCPSV